MKKILVMACTVLFLGAFVFAEHATAADRFVKSNDGTVTDTQTRLTWADHDSSDINWRGANSYCEGYSGGGKSGWRMPTLDELAQLYSSGAYGSVIRRTSSFVWSSQTSGPLLAAVFYFNGGASGWDSKDYEAGYRALPVRKVQ